MIFGVRQLCKKKANVIAKALSVLIVHNYMYIDVEYKYSLFYSFFIIWHFVFCKDSPNWQETESEIYPNLGIQFVLNFQI